MMKFILIVLSGRGDKVIFLFFYYVSKALEGKTKQKRFYFINVNNLKYTGSDVAAF